MSKILKNQTGAAIEIDDTGVTIPANPGQYTIPPVDYLLWAESSDVITEIGAGNLVVNDGSSDLSISEGTDLIKGIFPKTIGVVSGDDFTAIGHVGDSLKTDVTASALPDGAATEAKQDTGNTSLGSIDTKLTDNATATNQTAANASLSSIDGKVATAANQTETHTRLGATNETAPASDTATSGLNGRLQRIAQRISDLITTVTTGTGILSTIRGNTDGTLIGNVDDQLKVVSSPVDPGDFVTFKSNTEITLSSNTTWTNLHTVSGEGVLVGATFVIDNDQIECQILIDGNVIFDFTGEFLGEVVNKDADYSASGIFASTGDGKRLYFNPSTPFKYNTSLTFRARKSGKKVKYQLYTYSVI